MLDIDGVSRRDFLRVGALTTVGMSLPQLLALEAAAGPTRKAKAKNVLLVYLGGGLTHHDSLDPKPDAPAEIRGKYGVIPTGLAGVRFSDKMEKLAKCTDLFALCRGQVTGSDHHETATQWMLTGNYGFMQGGDFPSIGAIVAHELNPLNTLPPYVAVPRNASFTWELGKAAWLGERFESFKSGDCQGAGWKVPNLALLDGVDEKRLGRRQAMLQAIDNLARRVEGSDAVGSMDQFQRRAARMILSSDARRAFDLSQESDATREAYGGKNDRFGAQALLARRLIEGGVRFVLLNYGGWDHHANIFPECDRNLPALDRTLAALLTDMKRRGLLDETLVAVYGEFGRTSKINKDNGRDHWGNAGVLLFAGAGVRGGQVIGATDARGEYVTDRAIRSPEGAATLYHALGIDYQKALLSPQGRPVPILPECEPVRELWS
jgi:uncharacterized protein (DUF1501 family)